MSSSEHHSEKEESEVPKPANSGEAELATEDDEKGADRRRSARGHKRRGPDKQIIEEDVLDVEEKESPKKGRKSRKTDKTEKSEFDENLLQLPSFEVAKQIQINDVELEYSDDDFDNLNDFDSYKAHIEPLVADYNTGFPKEKINFLLRAKYNEFQVIKADPVAAKAKSAALDAERAAAEVVPIPLIPPPDQPILEAVPAKPQRKSKKAVDSDAEPTPGTKEKKKRRKKGEEVRRSGDSSDDEFEKQLDMLHEAQEAEEKLAAERKQARLDRISANKKPKHNSKRATNLTATQNLLISRKRKRLREDGDGYETDHQEHCEICNQGGEIILCDGCPRAWHLICLEPPLENAPDGKWLCPKCLKEGITLDDLDFVQTLDDQIPEDNEAFCKICKDGGELLCCDTCPFSYHLKCLDPPMEKVPDGEWQCHRCLCPPMKAEIQRILTWRWATPEKIATSEDEIDHVRKAKEDSAEDANKKREYFVKYRNLAYWYCDWVTELQIDVYQPILFRYYKSKVDMSEPPPLDDGSSVATDVKKEESEDPANLEERFFRYGVKPEWLQIHRVINHSVDPKKGVVWYLVKWCELPYDQATWEPEEAEIPDLAHHVDAYWAIRDLMFGSQFGERPGSKKKGKKGAKKDKDAVPFFKPPPATPQTDVSKRWEKQPAYIDETGGSLHDYQMDGVNWLRYSWSKNINTILADEMGLGKTIQTISFLYSLYKEGHSKGPFLVSAPLSTITNWEREFEFWAPDFYVVNYTGDRNSRAVIRENEFTHDENFALRLGGRSQKLKANTQVKFHVLLTSYELTSIDQSLLSSVNWASLVVDEAHRLKNNQSKFFRTLSEYKLDYRLLLTGTPLQNNLEELFNLLNFMESSRFDDVTAFVSQFADIGKEEQVTRLHELIGPHMLRRLKADVLKNMPSKSEFIVRVEKTALQNKYYKFILSRNFEALNAKGGQSTSLLNIMMDLKKCCNHPYLFAKAQMEAPKHPNGAYELGALVKACGKFELLQKMLQKLKRDGHRVLIFSQMTKVLDLLEEYLELEGYRYERLDGGTTGQQRQDAIDRFNQPNSPQFIFLLSTRAGGLGINLATADTVIIYDSDWNPHNDIQAFSRAHRIGQKSKVMIYRFVTRASVEESITQIAKKKMMLTHLVVRPGMSKGQTMSKQELDVILRFGTEKLFKDEEVEDTDRIVYSDEAIEKLLDRTQAGEAEREFAMNDYFQSFKVANFAVQAEESDDEDAEVIRQDMEEQDPHYWEKLLKHHYEQDNENEAAKLGKGKRLRKPVNYAMSGRNMTTHDNDDWEQPDQASDEEWMGGDAAGGDDEDFDGEDVGEEKDKRRARRGGERPLPPLLAKVAGQLEVLSFSSRQRRSFLNAIMRFGLPPTDVTPTGGSIGCGQWFVRDLKSKPEKVFRAYVTLFMRHLCEPGSENADVFADGVPRENMSRQLVLTRIGIMLLIRKKVQEFEGVNGLVSLPDEHHDLLAEANEGKAKEEGEEAVGDKDEETKKEEKDGEEKCEIEKKEEVKEETKEEPMEVETGAEVATKKEKEEEPSTTDEKPTEEVKEAVDVENETDSEPPKRKVTDVMFNIADGGFTELHSVWKNEEAALEEGKEACLWHRRHDYWLLAGIVNHGYGRWADIQQDDRFQIINRPFELDPKLNSIDFKNKFMARRFKLLEQALVIEEQLRRAVNLQKAQDPKQPVMALSTHFCELEAVAEANQYIAQEAQQNNNKTAAVALHKVLAQLEELLVEMKQDINRLPPTLSRLASVCSRLNMSERVILSKLVAGKEGASSSEQPPPSNEPGSVETPAEATPDPQPVVAE